MAKDQDKAARERQEREAARVTVDEFDRPVCHCGSLLMPVAGIAHSCGCTRVTIPNNLIFGK